MHVAGVYKNKKKYLKKKWLKFFLFDENYKLTDIFQNGWKISSYIKSLKEFFISRPTLKKVLKENLQVEGKNLYKEWKAPDMVNRWVNEYLLLFFIYLKITNWLWNVKVKMYK